MQPPDAASAQVRIVLADRYVLVRQGLQRLLDDQPGFRVVGQTGTAQKTLAAISHLRPDILVLGELLDSGALLFLERLAGLQPEVRPVLLTGETSRRVLAEAVALGASAIVPRNVSIGALLKCLSCVQAGVVFADHNPTGAPAGAPKPDPALQTLPQRERELAVAVAGGISNKAIAEKFSISELTVKRRLVDVFSKLGVSSRVQLAKYILDNGVPPGEGDRILLDCSPR